jgi:two-component sensor histidine kinase
MARRLFLIVLPHIIYYSSMAQVMPLRPMDEIRLELKNPKTEFDKANLLLDLALSYVYKPGEDSIDLDSAVQLIKRAEKINEHLQDKKIEARSDFVYSNALRERGKPQEGRQHIEKALATYKSISAPNEMGECWLELSSYYSGGQEGLKQKIRCFEEALPLFKAGGNKERQADVLKNLGDFHQIQRNEVQALKELKEALSIYQSIGYTRLQGVYDLLGTVSSELADYPNAVKYGLMAIKVAESVNDTTMQLGTIYNRVAISYSNWGKTEEAVIYLKKSMDIATKYKDVDAMEEILLSLCHQLYLLHKSKESLPYIKLTENSFRYLTRPIDEIDTAYLDMCHCYAYFDPGKYQDAKKYADQLIDITKRFPKPGELPTTVYRLLAQYFMGVHQYEEAEKYATTNLSFRILRKDRRTLGPAYLLISQVDSAMGDYQAALLNYQAYKKLTDSLLNESSAMQFAQMQVEYETEKKDKDIKLLKQNEQIQKAQLAQSRTANTVIIISLIVLALLMALLYSRYRIKQRHTKEIDEKNKALEKLIIEKDELISDKDGLLKEKEWLVKEIHHRVKNNLQMIISLLNAQSEFLNNPSAINAIRESRERMQAIALLHQKLYQGENNNSINMRSYVNELAETIRESVTDSGRIIFHVDVADTILDVSQSVPLGLILNEAITNAIKYAYPATEKGIISVSLQPTGAEQLQLKITDHGKGLPSDLDIEQVHSLGLQLIKLFAEQLDGDLNFINKNGLEIILNFRTTEYTRPHPQKDIIYTS